MLYNSNLAARTSLSFRIRPPGWKINISIVSILGSEAAANRKVCLNYRARAKVGIIFKLTTTSRKIVVPVVFSLHFSLNLYLREKHYDLRQKFFPNINLFLFTILFIKGRLLMEQPEKLHSPLNFGGDLDMLI